MKSKLILLSLATPLLMLAGGQPNHVSPNPEPTVQDRASLPQAVHQGKATGLSVSAQSIQANAYREQTPQENGYVARSDPHSQWNDNSAFHK